MDSLEKVVTDKHRVVVQLNKAPFQENRRPAGIIDAPQRPEKNDPYIAVDHTSLIMNNRNSQFSELMTFKQQKLYFDCVGNGYDVSTRSELSYMMDRLLTQHANCCMIRCTAFRENSLAVLNHLLILEANKRFQMNHLSLYNITLEFTEVRKFDVVNLFGNNVSQKRFQSTLDLQRWLNGEYPLLVNGTQGHKCLDFTFSYMNKRHQTYNPKLSFMHIVVSKLDNEAQTILRDHFENIHKRLRGSNSIILDIIRDYLSSKNMMKIWMFFDIPLQKNLINLTEDMLRLATAAYVGFDNICIRKRANVVNVDLLLPINTEVPNNKTSYLKNENVLQNKENEDLNYWYTKIDDAFSKVFNTMEIYYSFKYDNHIIKLCYDIKNMMSYKEFETIMEEFTFNAFDKNDLESEEKAELIEEHLMKYRNAILELGSLIDDIKISKNYESLKIYLRYKNYELVNLAMNLKIKKLEQCQNSISNQIRNELDDMKTPKQIPKNDINSLTNLIN